MEDLCKRLSYRYWDVQPEERGPPWIHRRVIYSHRYVELGPQPYDDRFMASVRVNKTSIVVGGCIKRHDATVRQVQSSSRHDCLAAAREDSSRYAEDDVREAPFRITRQSQLII